MEPIKVASWFKYIRKHPTFTGCLIDKDNDNEKFWFKNGLWHREDGPSYECADGYKEWWLNDMRYNSEQDYKIALRKLKLERVLKQIEG